MGLPPTLESTIRDLKNAERCVIHTKNGGMIIGSGTPNFAGLLLEQQQAEIETLKRDLDAKQARIDSLMFEYCPEEMTCEQVEAWKNHLRVVR